MSSLDETFDALLSRVRQADYLNPAQSDPIFYFVYPPGEMLGVKEHFPRWTARFREIGLTVKRVSFGELLWKCVDESGRWEEWLETEPDAEPEQLQHAVADVLTGSNRLIEKIAEQLKGIDPKSVLFLTDTELLHPYFRTRSIESALHDKLTVPVVIFYPGTRAGQYGLRFLGFYPEDPNYRSTIIGGV